MHLLQQVFSFLQFEFGESKSCVEQFFLSFHPFLSCWTLLEEIDWGGDVSKNKKWMFYDMNITNECVILFCMFMNFCMNTLNAFLSIEWAVTAKTILIALFPCELGWLVWLDVWLWSMIPLYLELSWIEFLFFLVEFQSTCVICTLGNNLSYEIQVQGGCRARA